MRFTRRLSNLAVAVSLLLCVATLAAWARSYWISHQLDRQTLDPRSFASDVFLSHRGRLVLWWTHYYYDPARTDAEAVAGIRTGWTWRSYPTTYPPPGTKLTLPASLGFGFSYTSQKDVFHLTARPSRTTGCNRTGSSGNSIGKKATSRAQRLP